MSRLLRIYLIPLCLCLTQCTEDSLQAKLIDQEDCPRYEDGRRSDCDNDFPGSLYCPTDYLGVMPTANQQLQNIDFYITVKNRSLLTGVPWLLNTANQSGQYELLYYDRRYTDLKIRATIIPNRYLLEAEVTVYSGSAQEALGLSSPRTLKFTCDLSNSERITLINKVSSNNTIREAARGTDFNETLVVGFR